MPQLQLWEVSYLLDDTLDPRHDMHVAHVVAETFAQAAQSLEDYGCTVVNVTVFTQIDGIAWPVCQRILREVTPEAFAYAQAAETERLPNQAYVVTLPKDIERYG